MPAVDVKTLYHAHIFDGDVTAGPFLLLFAANPDVAAASIAAEPAKAHFDLSKVLSDTYFIKHSKQYAKDILNMHLLENSRLKQLDFLYRCGARSSSTRP